MTAAKNDQGRSTGTAQSGNAAPASTEPSVNNFLCISWHDSTWIQILNVRNVMNYFSDKSNPFYDRTCNNEVIKMQHSSMDQLQNMVGIEYTLLHVQEPIMYIIRKQHRYSFTHVVPIADYYIIAGIVYQAPDLGSVISSRLLSAVTHLQSAFEEARSRSTFHPASGYAWTVNPSVMDRFSKSSTLYSSSLGCGANSSRSSSARQSGRNTKSSPSGPNDKPAVVYQPSDVLSTVVKDVPLDGVEEEDEDSKILGPVEECRKLCDRLRAHLVPGVDNVAPNSRSGGPTFRLGESPATLFQQRRVDCLLDLVTRAFPPPVPQVPVEPQALQPAESTDEKGQTEVQQQELKTQSIST